MGGVLAGTTIRQQFSLLEVSYPHRPTKDLYLVLEPKDNWQRTIHCCYQECDCPDFEPQELLEHLVKHAD